MHRGKLKSSKSFREGFTLAELLIAMAVFSIGALSAVYLLVGSHTASLISGEKTKAILLAKEGIEAARSIRDNAFANLNLCITPTCGIRLSSPGNRWEWNGAANDVTDGVFTRKIAVENVSSAKRKITSRVDWIFGGRLQSVSFIAYLVDFVSRFFSHTTLADFSAGSKNSATTTLAGTVELVAFGDWTNTILHTASSTDGTGNVNDIVISNDTLYSVADITLGAEFTAYDISNISGNLASETIIAKVGSFEAGAGINRVSVYNNYAYLATASTTAELIVVRLRDFAMVNFYDLDAPALAVFATSSVAYIVTENSLSFEEFYALNISNPEGVIALVSPTSRTELGANVNGLFVAGGYAYLVSADDLEELKIVRLSDYTKAAGLNFSGTADATSVFVSGNFAYITRLNSVNPEFYGVDITNPIVPVQSGSSAADLINGSAQDVFVANDGRAYIATSDDLKELIIISTVNYLEVGSANLTVGAGTDDALAVYFFGAYAYLGTANDTSEIAVIKGGPGAAGSGVPTLAGSYNTLGIYDANDVFISGSYAYIGTDSDSGTGAEFYIIDISVPSSPIVATNGVSEGKLDIGADVNKIYIKGNFAHLATGHDTKELVVINIAVKHLPYEAGTYNADGAFDGLSVFATSTAPNSTTTYLGTANNTGAGGAEFYALNTTNPTGVVLLTSTPPSRFDAGADINNISLSSNGRNIFLATALASGEFAVLDVANPSSITLVASTSTPASAFGLDYSPALNRVYLGSGNGGVGDSDFFIMNVTSQGVVENWSLPIEKGSYDVPIDTADANAVFVSGRYAYFVTDIGGSNQFHIVDIINPSAPALVKSLQLSGSANDIYVEGGYAFLASNEDDGELVMINVSLPSSASIVARYDADPGEGKNGLAVFATTTNSGIIAFLGTQNNTGNGDHEFYVLNPVISPITKLASYDVQADVYSIDVDPNGIVAYLATGHDTRELEILDITQSQFGTITEADSYDVPGIVDAYGVDYKSNFAYLVTPDNLTASDFFAIDVKSGTALDPNWQAAILQGVYDTRFDVADANALFLRGRYAFLVTNASGGQQLHIIDIVDPANPVPNPTPVGSVQINGNVNDIYITGNYIYLATSEDIGELVVINIATITSPSVQARFDADGARHGLSVFATSTAANVDTIYLGTQTRGGARPEFYILENNYSSGSAVVSGTPLGSYNLDADINSIKVSFDANLARTFAYAATTHSTKEFIILDVTNPFSILEADIANLKAPANAVNYNADIAYVTTDNGAVAGDPDLYVFDVKTGGAPAEDWANLVRKAWYDTRDDANPASADANAVFIQGNYAYLVTDIGDGQHFHIVNISNPLVPVKVGNGLQLSDNVNDVYVVNNYAYLATADNSKELIVIDVTDKNTPQQIASYDAEDKSDGLGVFAVGTTVYLVTRNNGGPDPNNREFYILNFDPVNKTVRLIDPAATYDVGSHVNGIYVSDSFAYLATEAPIKEFFVLNISNPAVIVEDAAKTYNIVPDTIANGVTYDPVGRIAYLAANNNATSPDFFIIDLNTSPPTVRSADLNTDNTAVVVSGNSAYISTKNPAEAATIVNPITLIETGHFAAQDITTKANDIVFDGSYIYLATGRDDMELQVIGPGTIFSPFISILGSADLNSDNTGVSVFGDKAYISTRSDAINGAGLTAVSIDLAAANFMQEVGHFNSQAASSDVVFYNNFAYLATAHDTKELQIVVAPPGTVPSNLIGNVYSTNLASDNNDVAVRNNFAYVATALAAEGLTIVDIANPAVSLSQIGTFNTVAAANGIFHDGTYAYLATAHDTKELQVIGPTAGVGGIAIELLGQADLGSDNRAIAFFNNKVYVATNVAAEGLTIVDVANPALPSQINSFNTQGAANGVVYNGAYVYLATAHDTMEFQIVAFDPSAVGWAREGWFISPALNSGNANTVWDGIAWTKSGAGTLQFKIRTADSSPKLSASVWVGSDGTAAAFYTNSSGENIIVDTGSSGTQWFQYKGYFSGDGSATPILSDITITYE